MPVGNNEKSEGSVGPKNVVGAPGKIGPWSTNGQTHEQRYNKNKSKLTYWLAVKRVWHDTIHVCWYLLHWVQELYSNCNRRGGCVGEK